ncbi:MAG: hypothetical protein P8L84_04150 [Methylococcaceae bacterium]|nr:hypothetical protein [Methylococcaceae bacterium]
MKAATRNPAIRGPHVGLVSDKKRKLSIQSHESCIAKKTIVAMAAHLKISVAPERTPPWYVQQAIYMVIKALIMIAVPHLLF